MTTPRDAIGLSERLRDDIAQLVTAKKHAEFAGAETGVRVKDPSLLLTDLTEAATALDALQADLQVKEQAVADMARTIDTLQARVNNLVVDRDTLAAWAKKEESRATSAEQERDEAYERLKPFAQAADRALSGEGSPDEDFLEEEHFESASDLVRRLAAGTEKEGE